jgi:valyl-tRNA synthetase
MVWARSVRVAVVEMIEKYSADAVRYWAASTGPGRDAVINEEKIQTGARLVTKLWNVARFCERFFEGYQYLPGKVNFSPADLWIRSRLSGVLERVTAYFRAYDYASAKSEAESFFWNDLADNYLEMCKQRLYALPGPANEAAKTTLYCVFLSLIKILAPFLPYITDEIYLNMFKLNDGYSSVHVSHWPEPEPDWYNPYAEEVGSLLIEVATAIRRYKSERNMSLGSELSEVKLAVRLGEFTPVQISRLHNSLNQANLDLISITRARQIGIYDQLPEGAVDINPTGPLSIAIDVSEGNFEL